MTAEKGNKVYLIDEKEKSSYQAQGFDIKDGDGNLIASGKGKTVSYEDHLKACKENERLHEKIAELEAAQVKETKGKKQGQEKEGE